MKRKAEKDHSGPGFMTPPKYLKEIFPWGIFKVGFLKWDFNGVHFTMDSNS